MLGNFKWQVILTWLNSAGVVVAIIVSIYSALLSRQAFALKREKLGFAVLPTTACKLEYHPFGDRGGLGLCWVVTLTNQSEDKLSVVSYRIFELKPHGLIQLGGFSNLEGFDGRDFGLPVTLDGGEAKALMVRAPILIDPKEAVLVNAFLKTHSASDEAPPSLRALENYLIDHDMNLVGDHVVAYRDEGRVAGWHTDSTPRYRTALVEFTTGRNIKSTATLSYPPLPAALEGGD